MKWIHSRDDKLFNKRYWKNWISKCKRVKLDLHIISYSNINPKWIKNLNPQPATIKLLEEIITGILQDISVGNELGLGGLSQKHKY